MLVQLVLKEIKATTDLEELVELEGQLAIQEMLVLLETKVTTGLEELEELEE
jgi:hypothetical protein